MSAHSPWRGDFCSASDACSSPGRQRVVPAARSAAAPPPCRRGRSLCRARRAPRARPARSAATLSGRQPISSTARASMPLAAFRRHVDTVHCAVCVCILHVVKSPTPSRRRRTLSRRPRSPSTPARTGLRSSPPSCARLRRSHPRGETPCTDAAESHRPRSGCRWRSVTVAPSSDASAASTRGLELGHGAPGEQIQQVAPRGRGRQVAGFREPHVQPVGHADEVRHRLGRIAQHHEQRALPRVGEIERRPEQAARQIGAVRRPPPTARTCAADPAAPTARAGTRAPPRRPRTP